MWNFIVTFVDEQLLSYSGMTVVGILAMALAAFLLSRKLGVDPLGLMPCLILSTAGLYFGAKLFGMLSYASYLASIGQTLDTRVFTESGMVFYGGLLGYIAMLYKLMPYLVTKRKVAWGITACVMPLFHGFARIGCYFAFCCYGVVSDSEFCSLFTEHRLPVQLIEAGFEFLLFGAILVLLLNYRRTWVKPVRDHLLALYLGCYSVFRFIIEFWRGDAVRGGLFGLSFSQCVALCVLIGIGVSFLKAVRSKKAALTPTE